MDSIRFFGTSAGNPTAERNVSSLVLHLSNKKMCLVDCGDGTCYQFVRGKEKLSRIAVIFITHMHSDHIFGLPGLLSCLTDKITVVGPVGIRAFVESSIAAVPPDSRVHELEIDFVELEPEKCYPVVPLSKEAAGSIGKVSVSAYPLSHRCPCFGYIFSELEDVWKIDSKKAMALGACGPELGRLSRWEEVLPASGGPLIRPQDVLSIVRHKRRAAIFGDTNVEKLRPETVEAVRGCDVLVCESTYIDGGDFAEKYMHSSIDMVSVFAKSVGVKKVFLNHFSPRDKLEDLKERATALFGGTGIVTMDMEKYTI